MDFEVGTIKLKNIQDTDRRNIISAFEMGISGVPLRFSTPVKVEMEIPKSEQFDLEYDPHVFIRVQHEGDSFYDDMAVSIDKDSTCSSSGEISDATNIIPIDQSTGIATFYTCQTSTYLGISSIDPAGSCWEIKQRDTASTDGVYWLQTPSMTVAEEFYCDMTYDGGGWVLLGRGREGWAWNNTGAGTAADIRNTITGTSAFTPAYLSATKVDELLNGGDVTDLVDGIRLNRTEDNTGTTFQDFQMLLTSQTNWSWIFDTGFAISEALWVSASQGSGSDGTTGDNTQVYSIPASNFLNLETNTLAGPSNSEGFAYGGNLFGGNTSTDWGYQLGPRSTIPFTQIYIRPEVLRGPLLDRPIGRPLLWVDALDVDGDLDETNNPADGTAVTTWVDKSGNGNDLTAINVGAQAPTYTTTAGFGTLPAIQIDNTQLGFDTPASFSSTSNDYTIFSVLRQDAGSAGYNGFYMYDQNIGNRFLINQGTSVSSDALYFDGGFGPAGFGDNGDNLATWIFEQGATNEFVFRRDGVQVATDATVVPFTISNDGRFGARYTAETVGHFDGVFAEILIYDSTLSEAEIESTERYLDCKWDVTSRDDCDAEVTVYRGGTNTDIISTTVTNIVWPDLLSENTLMQRNANTFDFDLDEGGHYLVTYSIPTVSTSGSDRSEMQSWLRINDSTNLPYGRGSGYIRRSNGNNEGYNEGAAILNQPPGSTVRVQMQRTDNNTATVGRRANASGINILKLDDEWDYLRTRPSSNQAMTTSFADVTFGTDDELDDGYSRSAGAVTLEQAGHYLVTYNVAFSTTNSTRTNNESALFLDGSGEINGTRSAAYLRGSNSTNNGVASFVGIIETTTPNEVLRLQVRRESSLEGANNQVQAANTGMTIVKLPDTASYIRLEEDGGGQNLPTTQVAVTMDTALEEDDSFTYDPSGTDESEIRIETAGNYLFLHSMYNARADISNGPREAPFFQWTKNGIVNIEQYGGSGSFNRTSSDGSGITNSSASSSGFIAPSLSVNDIIQLTQTNEASDNTSVLLADRLGIQGVYIPSLFEKNPETAQIHYRWRDDAAGLNTTGSWVAAEDIELDDVERNTPYRVRVAVANEGFELEGASRQYQLQWGDRTNTGSCAAVTTWNAIDTVSDPFELVDSTFISNGESTTSGLLANVEGYTFVDGEGRDTSDTTGNIGPLDENEYTELEFSLQATDYAVTGHEYCFRLFDDLANEEMDSYLQYPVLSVKAKAATLTSDEHKGEYGQVTLSPGVWTAVTFQQSITDPIVIGSPRYDGSTTVTPERTVRMRSKTTTGFEMKVDNHDATVSGTTLVDWAAFAQGDYEIDLDGGGTMQVYADTQTTSTEIICAGGSTGSGDTINFPTSFGSTPVAFFNVSSDGFTDWVHASVSGVGAGSMEIGLDGSFEACGHGSEDIDYVVLEQVHDDLMGNEFEASLSADNVSGTPVATGYSNNFTSAFTSAPGFLLTAKQKIDGANGGASYIHTAGAQTTTTYATAIDEFGVSADRAHTGESVSILAFTNTSGLFSNKTVYLDQTHFRWYENVDSVTPVTALESENTQLSEIDFGEQARLRLLLQNGKSDLDVDMAQIKLQYGEGDNCDAIVTWNDVGSSGSAEIWRGFDNPLTTDGTGILSSLLFGGGHALETYEEDNPTLLNPVAISTGAWGEWDFVLENNGAVDGENYCFRVVSVVDDEICYTEYATAIAKGTPELTFDMSDSTIGFGQLTLSGDRYATGDELGSSTEVEAHQISVSSNAPGGYTVTVQGPSLTNGNGDVINPITGGASAPLAGTEQFGIRLDPNLTINTLGTGIAMSPYDTSGYVYEGQSLPSVVATGVGDNEITDFDLYYMSNIDSLTPAGEYMTNITYIVTGDF